MTQPWLEDWTLSLVHKKKRSFSLVDFTIPADQIVKIIENEKLDTCNLQKSPKSYRTVILIIIRSLGTIPKRLEELEIHGRIETTLTTKLLRSARILQIVLETYYHSNFSKGHQLVLKSKYEKNTGSFKSSKSHSEEVKETKLFVTIFQYSPL